MFTFLWSFYRYSRSIYFTLPRPKINIKDKSFIVVRNGFAVFSSLYSKGTQEENLLIGLCSVHTPISHTKLKIHTYTCRQSRFETTFSSSTCFFVGPSRYFKDQETQEDNYLGGTNSFAGQVLHPGHLLYKVQDTLSTFRQS